MSDRCVHCGAHKGQRRRRGLCLRCHADLGVRAQYPTTSKYGPASRRGEPDTDAMTAAELDAFVAEGLLPENLPDWWGTSYDLVADGE